MSQIFSHSGDIGDLLAALSVVRQVGGGELVLYPAACTGYRMTLDRFRNLKSLLELQPYLSSVRYANNPEGTNLDEWRNNYNNDLNITDMVAACHHQAHPEREQPWLCVDRPNRVARVLFARSDRYHNEKVDWQRIYNEYHRIACFVGTPDEHADFVRAYGPISYHYTRDYLELARVVAGADLVCVNQTSIRWLAEGLKIPVIVEVYLRLNNTHFDRVGAHYLYSGSDIPLVEEISERAIRSAVQRANGRTLITQDRLESIARLIYSIRGVPGAMAELGSYRGGSASVISGCCPEKLLRVFDTFSGIPEDDVCPEGHKEGEFSANFLEVKNYLNLCQIEFVVGKFPESANGDSHDRYSFVHLDGDTYQSTVAGLKYFLPRLHGDGIIVLDDFGWSHCPGVKQACEELGLVIESSCIYQGVYRHS